MALAAYNAGPGAVDRWRPNFETDADIWIDTIPFEETRKYVRIVLEYAAIYQWQGRSGQPLRSGRKSSRSAPDGPDADRDQAFAASKA